MNNIIKNNCFLDLRQASNLTVETIMLYSILLFYFVILLNVNFDKCLSCDLEDVFTRIHAVCPLKNDTSLVSIHLIIYTLACLAGSMNKKATLLQYRIYELHCEKTGFLHMQKQRRRSASR